MEKKRDPDNDRMYKKPRGWRDAKNGLLPKYRTSCDSLDPAELQRFYEETVAPLVAYAIQRDAMGHPVNVNGLALTYTAAGRLAGITYAPGQTVTYAYDPAGRLSSVSDWLGGQTTY